MRKGRHLGRTGEIQNAFGGDRRMNKEGRRDENHPQKISDAR